MWIVLQTALLLVSLENTNNLYWKQCIVGSLQYLLWSLINNTRSVNLMFSFQNGWVYIKCKRPRIKNNSLCYTCIYSKEGRSADFNWNSQLHSSSKWCLIHPSIARVGCVTMTTVIKYIYDSWRQWGKKGEMRIKTRVRQVCDVLNCRFVWPPFARYHPNPLLNVSYRLSSCVSFKGESLGDDILSWCVLHCLS